MVILLLAGLQALPVDVKEAAKVDGANAWQTFWEITFPLMLPVSVTAIILRTIFELKLADIVINVTAGGPGGATDTISSFVFREYRDRSNVGYATMVAEVYLIIIIIFIMLLLKLASRLYAEDDLRARRWGPTRANPWRDRGDDRNRRRVGGRRARRRSRLAGVLGGPLWRAGRSCTRSVIGSGRSSRYFPIYWTLSTSVKLGRDVTQGHLIPWVDFSPCWKGWQSLGLSPDTIFQTSNVREEFLKKFINSVICSVGASTPCRHDRFARSLRPQPLRLQIRPLAEQGHLLLLRLPAHLAARRARAAVSRSLQGAGAARHADRPHSRLQSDGPARS